MPDPGQIDTHQHVVPPEYRDWLADHDITAGGLPIPEWSAQAAEDFMGSHGISTGLLSVSTPVVHLGDNAEARTWARKVNEFVADVVRERPGSFGLFATLTLPDVDGALAEAAYAFDELDADGVVLLTNVAGTYLGDPSFEPLFAELGRPLAPALASAAELLREFYFDVALSSGPSALPSLLGFADPARITYGSDYPYAPAEIAAGFGHSYERYPIEADLRRAIDRGNAEALFPRLTSVQS